jgi:putative transposase
MNSVSSIKQTQYECKYHIIFIPKYRKKLLYGQLKSYLGEIFHSLAKQKGCEILQGHICKDHIHMLISIPPKYAVSDIVGFIKGKSAISIARTYLVFVHNYVFNGLLIN